ncbi:sugar ABC transporter permease [Mesorhizobium sp. B2-4-12]|uniref:carbohydrate ABC transporter permease n=1 Tax=unclassified Mesorhizobium TaxID=325217 RepID=UPI00112E73B8|nr:MULTISPECIES: sugar ABC transporter permease [unclassified Mesorhizobium]TPK93901.1 sugar ABC transporter permease [Mesorhizobium sp. B2-4-12]TPL09598.1 sugar ABC transporter permease [Mesorhizobium sp. B2-4-14]TPM24252.1 sugar ABC transporter permease [Mesorhizobium sp. B2-3-5]
MSTFDTFTSEFQVAPGRPAHRWTAVGEKLQTALLIAPVIVSTLVFVYLFIILTVLISLSDWSVVNLGGGFSTPLLKNYHALFANPRFQIDLRNTVIFTVLFLTGSVGLGLILALLINRNLPGKGFFRSVFLFPYAISFIVTGVAWRWIFNPETGVNVLINLTGINSVLAAAGIGPFKPGWLTDPTVLAPLNDTLGGIFPFLGTIQLKLGIPVALIAVAIAASWQLAGFAMATFLAGLATIPSHIKEAAAIDNASGWTYFRKITWPMLAPFTVINLVILGHVSLKIFDLVYVMSGPGPGFATDVPGIFVFETTFRSLRYGVGAAGSVVMLAMVAVIVVPYLIRTMPEDK